MSERKKSVLNSYRSIKESSLRSGLPKDDLLQNAIKTLSAVARKHQGDFRYHNLIKDEDSLSLGVAEAKARAITSPSRTHVVKQKLIKFLNPKKNFVSEAIYIYAWFNDREYAENYSDDNEMWHIGKKFNNTKSRYKFEVGYKMPWKDNNGMWRVDGYIVKFNILDSSDAEKNKPGKKKAVSSLFDEATSSTDGMIGIYFKSIGWYAVNFQHPDKPRRYKTYHDALDEVQKMIDATPHSMQVFQIRTINKDGKPGTLLGEYSAKGSHPQRAAGQKNTKRKAVSSLFDEKTGVISEAASWKYGIVIKDLTTNVLKWYNSSSVHQMGAPERFKTIPDANDVVKRLIKANPSQPLEYAVRLIIGKGASAGATFGTYSARKPPSDAPQYSQQVYNFPGADAVDGSIAPDPGVKAVHEIMRKAMIPKAVHLYKVRIREEGNEQFIEYIVWLKGKQTRHGHKGFESLIGSSNWPGYGAPTKAGEWDFINSLNQRVEGYPNATLSYSWRRHAQKKSPEGRVSMKKKAVSSLFDEKTKININAVKESSSTRQDQLHEASSYGWWEFARVLNEGVLRKHIAGMAARVSDAYGIEFEDKELKWLFKLIQDIGTSWSRTPGLTPLMAHVFPVEAELGKSPTSGIYVGIEINANTTEMHDEIKALAEENYKQGMSRHPVLHRGKRGGYIVYWYEFILDAKKKAKNPGKRKAVSSLFDEHFHAVKESEWYNYLRQVGPPGPGLADAMVSKDFVPVNLKRFIKNILKELGEGLAREGVSEFEVFLNINSWFSEAVLEARIANSSKSVFDKVIKKVDGVLREPISRIKDSSTNADYIYLYRFDAGDKNKRKAVSSLFDESLKESKNWFDYFGDKSRSATGIEMAIRFMGLGDTEELIKFMSDVFKRVGVALLKKNVSSEFVTVYPSARPEQHSQKRVPILVLEVDDSAVNPDNIRKLVKIISGTPGISGTPFDKDKDIANHIYFFNFDFKNIHKKKAVSSLFDEAVRPNEFKDPELREVARQLENDIRKTNGEIEFFRLDKGSHQGVEPESYCRDYIKEVLSNSHFEEGLYYKAYFTSEKESYSFTNGKRPLAKLADKLKDGITPGYTNTYAWRPQIIRGKAFLDGFFARYDTAKAPMGPGKKKAVTSLFDEKMGTLGVIKNIHRTRKDL